MCIAILNPNSVTLKKKVLKNCWDNNRDGAGLLYLANGVLTTHKEMKNFDSFYDHYAKVRKEHSKSQIVIHFRISTHGKVNETNCHPFIVDDKWGFVHNGIIYAAPKHNDFSDTYMFNEHILKKLPEDWMFNEAIYDLVQDYIGSSKLLFLNTDNDAYIINEEAGVWDLGCWFSNTTYKPSKYYDFGGKSILKGSTATTPITTTGSKWRSSADWDAWEDDYDTTAWDKKYKWNEATRTYDKREDYVDETIDDGYAPNSWSIESESAFHSVCESCLERKLCKYDYSYDCDVCKECASSIYDETPTLF